MPLVKQKVSFAFSGSIDEHTDEKLVSSGYVQLDNIDRDKLGTVNKRTGYTNGDVSTTSDEFHSLAPIPGGCLALAKGSWWGVNVGTGNSYETKTALHTKVTGWRAKFVGQDIVHYDVAADGSGQYVCLTWEDSAGGSYCQVFEISTQSPVTEVLTVHASGLQPKVVPLGDDFAVFYLRSSNTLGYRVLSTSTWALASEATVSTNVVHSGTSACFDVGVGEDSSNNSDVYILSSRNSAAGYLLFKMNTSGTVTTIASGTFEMRLCDVRGYYLDSANTVIAAAIEDDPASGVWLLSVDADASSVNWGWTDASKSSSDFDQVTVSRAVNADGASSTAKGIVTVRDENNSDLRHLDFTLDGTLGSAYTAITVPGGTYALTGKQYFEHDATADIGYTNVPLYTAGQELQHEFLGSVSPLTGTDLNIMPVGILALNDFGNQVASDNGSNPSGVHGSMPRFAKVSAGKYVSATLIRTVRVDYDNADDDYEFSVQFNIVDHSGTPPAHQAYGQGVFVADGIGRYFVNGGAQENIPLPQPLDPQAGAGSATGLTGTFNYRYVWEYEDDDGLLHRSAPSNADSVTLSNQKGSVSVTCPFFSDQVGNIRAAVYRTEASGSVYYHVGSVQCDTTASVSFSNDNVSDANLISQPLLYTEGGVLEAQTPPPFCAMTRSGRRIWAINGLHQREIWPSKLLEPGIAPEWNAALKIVSPAARLIGLASFDDKVIAFSPDRIYVQTGDGPDNTGNGQWPDLQRLPSPVGCSTAASIVVTHRGAFFEAEGKIWLLDRSLQVQDIGLRVKDTSASATIVGAEFFPTQDEVVWALSDQTFLIYNIVENAWHTHSPQISGSDINHMVRAENQLVFVANDDVYRESTGFADESTTFQGMTIVTPWLKLNQLQGFQRIYSVTLLGEFVDDHDLTVEIGYDFSAAYSETKTFNQDVGDGDTQLSPYQLRIMPAKQKCQAIRFRIKDVQPAKGASAGPKLTGLLIEYGAKRGAGFKTLGPSHTT